MYLKDITCVNFKNHSNLKQSFSSHVNYIYGNNGIGKTNLLDAVYYLSMTKSYFNHIDSLTISYDKKFFTLAGNFIKLNVRDDEVIEHAVHLSYNTKKKIKLDDSTYKKLKDHIGLFPIIFFNPDDSDAIKYGSEYRRKIIDTIICQMDPSYLKNLINYNLLLKNRNSLIKKFAESNSIDKDLLNHYDNKIIPLAENIFCARESFTKQLNELFIKRYFVISENEEKPSIIYKSQLQKDKLYTLFNRSLHIDIGIGYTSYGIHKDDYIFFLNNKKLKNMSQGQKKTFFISLRFAQRDFIKKKKNINPILLMDDIFEKLDENRIKNLTNIIKDPNIGQIFITDSSNKNLKFLDTIPSLKVIDINALPLSILEY